MKQCNHEIGRKCIEHHGIEHPSGEQLCLKCGLTLNEIIEKAQEMKVKEIRGGINRIKIVDINKKGPMPDGLQRNHNFGFNEAIDDILNLPSLKTKDK